MSETRQFQHEDDGYLTWLEEHPEGFVLNIDTYGRGKHVVHSARCKFLYPPRPNRSPTTYRKVVSERLDPLEAWESGTNRTVAHCFFCLQR